MKKIIIGVMVIFCLCGIAQAGWEQIARLPTTLNYNYSTNIFFSDTEHGWIFGGKYNHPRTRG